VFNHRGREVGEGIFIERAVVRDGRSLSLLEFTFGLERILWALNGNSRYGLNIGSPTLRVQGAEQVSDACRTATLMLRTGMVPSASGIGLKARRLISHLTTAGAVLEPALRYSYVEWSNFITAASTIDDCVRTILDEVRHKEMIDVARRIGSANTLASQCRTADELILRTLRGGARIDEICGKYNEKKEGA
jgi:hypothetical protein